MAPLLLFSLAPFLPGLGGRRDEEKIAGTSVCASWPHPIKGGSRPNASNNNNVVVSSLSVSFRTPTFSLSFFLLFLDQLGHERCEPRDKPNPPTPSTVGQPRYDIGTRDCVSRACVTSSPEIISVGRHLSSSVIHYGHLVARERSNSRLEGRGGGRVEVRECTVTKLLFSSENMSLWLTWDRARMCFDSVKEVFSLDFFRSLIGKKGGGVER